METLVSWDKRCDLMSCPADCAWLPCIACSLRKARQLASYAYLRQELEHPLAAASLAWTVQALVSENWDAAEFDPDAFHLPLKVAVERVIRTDGAAHRLNLLMLAALMRQSPVLDMPALSLNSIAESTP